MRRHAAVVAALTTLALPGKVLRAQECDLLESQRLSAPLKNDAYFGASVSTDGELLVCGVPDVSPQQGPGSVYLYRRAGDTWEFEATLVASDGADGDAFGSSVAVAGSFLFVGAPGRDEQWNSEGAVYVFRREGTGWVEQAKLLASDPYQTRWFGDEIAADGDTLLVGVYRGGPQGDNTGAAYIFEWDGQQWTENEVIQASDWDAGDNFGCAVAIKGETAAIGARHAGPHGAWAGAVYVYAHEGSRWVEKVKLLASDGVSDDHLGEAVAIDGDTVFGGAPYADGRGRSSGAVYVFSRNSGEWTEQAKLEDPRGSEWDPFGFRVAASQGTLIIGTPSASPHDAHVFRLEQGEWRPTNLLLPTDDETAYGFGESICVAGDSIFLGAPGAAIDGVRTGAVYAYDLGNPNCLCPPDLNHDGVIDTRDFVAYLALWAYAESAADWNNDGAIDTRDFIAYLSDWAAGC